MKMAKVIYLSGPDGSGKTSSFLRALEVIDQENKTAFQLRTLQVGRLHLISRKHRHSASTGPGGDPHTLGSVGRIGYSDLPRNRGHGFNFTMRRYIGLVAGILDIITFGRTFLHKMSRKYDFILVEECPVDIFAKRHRPFFPLTAWLTVRLFPKPDLLVYCIADPAVIAQRKPELTEVEIELYYSVMNRIYGYSRFPIYTHYTNPSSTPYEDLEKVIRRMAS